MNKVMADISVSLDGFVAGPDDGVDLPLGRGGTLLHEWVYGLEAWRKMHGLEGGVTGPASDLFEAGLGAAGAFIMGHNMLTNGEGPWGDEPPFRAPVFVLTHQPREPLEKRGGTVFHFLDDDLRSVLDQARAAAGAKDVAVAGGANVIQQFIEAGLLDELEVHLVPVLLGGGVRLFEAVPGAPLQVTCTRSLETEGVVHLSYRFTR